MKKLIATLCVVSLMSAAVLPALAEQNGGMQNEPPQMTQSQNGMNQQPGGMGGFGQPGDTATPPEKPDGDTSTGTMTPPAMPGTSSDTMTPPEKPDGDTASGTETSDGTASGIQALPSQTTDGTASGIRQFPSQPENQFGGQMQQQPGSMGGEMNDPLQQLVTDGKLSETTYEAILNYMSTYASADTQTAPGETNGETMTPPEKPDGDTSADTQTPPEKPEGDTAANTQTPPELPDGDAASGMMTPPEMADGFGGQFQPGMNLTQDALSAMLDGGVITQDEYDLLLETIAQPEAAADTAASEASV